MFCRKCGYQLEDDAEFCTQCGTRVQPEIVQPEAVQSKSIRPDMVQVSVNNSASDDVSSGDSKRNKNKKGIKKQVLIPVIAVVVIAIIAAVILVVLHKNKKSLTPQEDAIDRYFNAINDVDYEEFNHVVYSEDVADKRLEEDYARGSFLNNHYFLNGNMSDGLANLDPLRMPECIKETYSEYLEQSRSLSDGNYDEPEEWLRNHFSASYKINYIKAFDDCKLQQWRRYLWEDVTKDDIEKAVSYTNISTGESIDVEVDDIYVASINFEWEYDGNLYGFDKELWKNKDFIEFVEGNRNLSSYADAVDSKEEYCSNVIMVVYSVDDNWYAMPFVLSRSNQGSYSVAD